MCIIRRKNSQWMDSFGMRRPVANKCSNFVHLVAANLIVVNMPKEFWRTLENVINYILGTPTKHGWKDKFRRGWIMGRRGILANWINLAIKRLQIIADSHTEESKIGSSMSTSMIGFGSGHAYADNFENGFRFFVHDQHAMPYLSTEGISVTPGSKVYSAISPTKVYLEIILIN